MKKQKNDGAIDHIMNELPSIENKSDKEKNMKKQKVVPFIPGQYEK